MNTHVMVDMETLNTSPDTVVLSLGAVKFTRDNILDKRLWIPSMDQQLKAKRAASAATLCWWLDQGDAAKTIFKNNLKNGQDMRTVFTDFLSFVGSNKIKIWSNGATFDIVILENILNTMKLNIPWKYWDHRCYRTLKAMHKIEEGQKRDGIKHDALDDAIYQAGCLMAFLQKNQELDK